MFGVGLFLSFKQKTAYEMRISDWSSDVCSSDLSFYDWYCDLPPSSPQTFGEQTDVPESADWYNAMFLLIWGSNVPQARTPDAHFYTEVRYKGARSVVISPDYSEAAKLDRKSTRLNSSH